MHDPSNGGHIFNGVADEQTDDDGVLGTCGCVDYHYSDCPTRTGGSAYEYEEED